MKRTNSRFDYRGRKLTAAQRRLLEKLNDFRMSTTAHRLTGRDTETARALQRRGLCAVMPCALISVAGHKYLADHPIEE